MGYQHRVIRPIFAGALILSSACSYDWSTHARDAGADGDSGLPGVADGGTESDGSDPTSDGGDRVDGSDVDASAGCSQGANASCVAGSDVDCTTTCGTTGHGECTDACAAPGPASCAPPAEVCNLVDDDCDGVVDPDGLALRAGDTRAWGAPTAEADPTTQVSMVSRPGGGAWMFYGAPGATPGTYVALLNEDGSANGPARAPAALANDSSMAVTAAGSTIAILGVDASSSDFHVRLFRANDFVPIDELTVAPPPPCSFVRAVDIAAKDDDGTLKIAWIGHVYTLPKNSAGACDYSSANGTGTFALWVAQRNSTGLWSTVKRGMSVGEPNLLTLGFAAVRPWLCGDGWAVLRMSAELGVSLTHADEGGVAQSVLAGVPGEGSPASPSSVSLQSGDCKGDGDELQAVFLDHAGLQAVSDFVHSTDHAVAAVLSVNATLRTWRRSNDPTTSQATSTDARIPGLPLALTRWGGAARLLSVSPRKTILLQSIVGPVATDSVEFAVPEDAQGDSFVQFFAAGHAFAGGAPTTSLVHAGSAFVIGRSRALKTATGALDQYRAPDDANPTCALTQALACSR